MKSTLKLIIISILMNTDMPSLNLMNGLKVDRIGASRHILRIEIPSEGKHFLTNKIISIQNFF